MRKHLSVDLVSLEKHHDKFNIDWIRYFTRDSFLINFSVSVFAMLLWLKWQPLWGFTASLPFKTLGMAAAVGAGLYFFTLAATCHFAGNNFEESARLAGRRGLFSYAAMSPVIVALLALFGMLAWDDPLSKSITLVLTGQILCGITACVAELLVPLLRHRIRR